jgi:hypothetical protein
MLALGLSLTPLSLGCNSHQGNNAPPAPSSGGFAKGTGSAAQQHDSGTAGTSSDDDAGNAGPMGDTPLIECTDVDPAMFKGEDTPLGQFFNAISAPTDLVVTRVVATWEESCVQPTIRIEMSDGDCPKGKGHSLSFLLDAGAIAGGSIRRGVNTIIANPGSDGIQIRYVRPASLSPRGTWGTCTDASGTVEFPDDLATAAFSTLKARFDLELGTCDGSTNPVQTVSGTFNVLLRRGVAEVCPLRP